MNSLYEWSPAKKLFLKIKEWCMMFFTFLGLASGVVLVDFLHYNYIHQYLYAHHSSAAFNLNMVLWIVIIGLNIVVLLPSLMGMFLLVAEPYQSTAEITQYSKTGVAIRTYKFNNIWPSEIAPSDAPETHTEGFEPEDFNPTIKDE